MRGTHTYAALEVSAAAYDEIHAKLEGAGYQHAFDDNGAIDMYGIGLVREERAQVLAGIQPHQQRVVDEKAALDANIGRLTAFRATPTFVGLASAEQDRLNRQQRFMELYSAVLGERIDAFMPRAPVGKLGLPQWKCHKVVGAAKITDMRPNPHQIGWNLTLDFGDDVEHQQYVDPVWAAKHRPLIGGYFVEYEDGYTSFSPAEAFEKGYTRI